MPYIKMDRRVALLSEAVPENPGELNFMITQLLYNYVNDHKLCYQVLNDISGAMTEALAEFRRRIIVPYEESKKKANGDVYGKE